MREVREKLGIYIEGKWLEAKRTHKEGKQMRWMERAGRMRGSGVDIMRYRKGTSQNRVLEFTMGQKETMKIRHRDQPQIYGLIGAGRCIRPGCRCGRKDSNDHFLLDCSG